MAISCICIPWRWLGIWETVGHATAWEDDALPRLATKRARLSQAGSQECCFSYVGTRKVCLHAFSLYSSKFIGLLNTFNGSSSHLIVSFTLTSHPTMDCRLNGCKFQFPYHLKSNDLSKPSTLNSEPEALFTSFRNSAWVYSAFDVDSLRPKSANQPLRQRQDFCVELPMIIQMPEMRMTNLI